MCDQTEVTYATGDVVWVKLGPVWWPGQVQDYEALPEEITANLRKKPIAVVKFFQEESFEYVKNLDHIYYYNCQKKEEFIKKGLDMVRSANSRDVPSNMNLFPNDIATAEHLTGGDPNILHGDTFAPAQKKDYSDLFGTKKSSGKKGKKESIKREQDTWKSRNSSSPVFNDRRSLPSTIPRPITHPRFITKALEGRSDHEVRIRYQSNTPRDGEGCSPTEKKYRCHICNYETIRLNVIVLHNKSHSAGVVDTQNVYKSQVKKETKSKENITPTITLLGDQTPTTTSRGRVKSLPKKLMDYTDEPPPKIMKEKIFVKSPSKEDVPASVKVKKVSTENLSPITPKIEKEEKTSIKRPLFGKRKTAKEKAEIVAKQKQEHEAMKETLLKDWDEDDVNEEEVELEQLKQALESTTATEPNDDSAIATEEVPSPPQQKVSPIIKKKFPVGGSKINVKDDIKAKVFDFDDSEDSLPVHISFRQKSKPEKFTDDKFKKPKPPKPLRVVSKSKVVAKPPQLMDNKKEEDTETAHFNEACNALLEETVVPLIPDIPTGIPGSKLSTQISDQTSDISSSTDLMEVDDVENLNVLPQKNVLDSIQDNNLINDDLHMECTSSDSEEIKLSDHNNASILKENQKNFEEISAGSPRVEIDSDSMSGVATTTTNNVKVSCDPSIVIKGLGSVCEDLVVTEISSTCDVAKRAATEEESQLKLSVNNSSLNLEMQETPSIQIVSPQTISEEIYNRVNEQSTNENEQVIKTEFSSLEEDVKKQDKLEEEPINTSAAVELDVKDSTINSSPKCVDFAVTSDSNIFLLPNEKAPKSEQAKSVNLLTEFKLDTSEPSICYIKDKPVEDAIKDEVVKEETITVQEVASNVIEEKIIEYSMSEQIEPEYIIPEHELEIPASVQLTLPSETSQFRSEQPLQTIQEITPKMEMSETCQLGTQNLSQNLQDMELDINSMPVIIGGEDFIQPEQPKQPVPIQPKYTESIVISPKKTSSKPNKSESVIMHFGEPSTSNQNLQSVISIPSKSGKGGVGRVKVQKTSSKTIKLPASALKSLGSLQKGGNQQVLILKTTSQKGKQLEKGMIPSNKGPLNMFQHGNKILIVNNPQMSGQNKIRLNPQQQQLLTGGKLAPGTRVFTSKVVATTTSQSAVSPTGTVSKPAQKLVISKGGLITSSKSVIINNSPSKFVTTIPGSQTVANTKGQTLIAHNILNTKGGLVLSNSSQSVSSAGKTATIITSQALATSKGMILTPITSKGGTILSGNQKLRIVSSKAPMSGTKLVVQKTQKKIAIDPQKQGQMKMVSGIRGQAPASTILIQTSQGLVAKSVPSSTISTIAQPTMKTTKTVLTTVPTQAKIRMSPASVQPPILPQPVQPKAVQPPAKKVGIQKIRPGPNILQKTQRKSTPRTPRSSNRFISPAVPKTEPIILSTTSNLPVIAQPAVAQGQIPQNTEGLVYLTMDEAGNYRQIENKSLITFEGNPAEAPQTIFIPANSQADVSNMNIFLAIDDAGNIVNITQPPANPTFSTETPAPSQDILAKALANTQVLQQETMPDVDVSTPLTSVPVEAAVITNSSFNEQAQYPAPPLSRTDVLQTTSLTLNQPIMTPLEVPSAVSPNMSQISPLSSNYITQDLLTTKQKHIRPSMPLLTEESLQAQGEPVFLLDSSNNLVPATSGSQISFQLLSDNNMIVASGGEVLPPSYEVITSDMIAPHQLVPAGDTVQNTGENIGSVPVMSHEEAKGVTYSVIAQGEQMSEPAEAVHQSIILREALEAPKPCKTDHLSDNVEEDQHVSLANDANSQEYVDTQQSYIVQNTEIVCNQPERVHESDELENSQPMIVDTEIKHSLKRTLGEEQAVTSSSDPKDSNKRIRIDER